MKIILKNKIEELSQLVPFIESFFEQEQLPSTQMFQINLALDEIVTNVINYAYPGNEKHEFCVEMSHADGEIVVEVRDSGVAFDPTQQPVADTTLSVEERPIGGLGITIVREMMDSVTYKREDGENILTLKKSIK